MNTCEVCGDDISNRHTTARFCLPCCIEREREYGRRHYKKYPNAHKAHRVVQSAINRGEIIDLKTQSVACVDCGVRAQCYDHRDYLKPLQVDPVCFSCNKLRGEGLNRS